MLSWNNNKKYKDLKKMNSSKRKVAKEHARWCARQQRDLSAQAEEAPPVDWDSSPKVLLEVVKNSNSYFDSMEHDALKAVLLHHMNLGYSQFWGIQSQSFDTDIDKLVEEVCNEMLSNEERKEMFNTSMNEQQYASGVLISCSACGFRELRWGRGSFPK
jgi:hypothetical protein